MSEIGRWACGPCVPESGNRRDDGILGEFNVAAELLEEFDADRTGDSLKVLLEES